MKKAKNTFKKREDDFFFCSWVVKFHDDLEEIETLASSGDFELEGELHISWGVVVKVSCSQAVNSLLEILALCQRQSPLLHNVASPHGERLQGNESKWCGVSANHWFEGQLFPFQSLFHHSALHVA